jgi:HPt (histidine-containing phosphotransfer) domain-containing protein
MFDLIMIGGVGLLLVVVLFFLVIVIRDHRKSHAIKIDDLLGKKEEADSLKVSFEKPGAVRSGPKPEPKTEPKRQAPEPPAVKPEPEPEPAPQPQPTPAPQKSAEAIEAEAILTRDYGNFSHQRLIDDMGLTDAEAQEFVQELIHQLEATVDELDRLIEAGEYERLERVTHGVKGASLNVGEGGVAQLLVDYNTYLKSASHPTIVQAYQQRFKELVAALKSQY